MLVDMPGRGIAELVPVTESQILLSGPECKDKCYANFLMCGDHRMQTESKITKVFPLSLYRLESQRRLLCGNRRALTQYTHTAHTHTPAHSRTRKPRRRTHTVQRGEEDRAVQIPEKQLRFHVLSGCCYV